MRILHLIPHLSGGGAEQQLSYLAPEQALMGHDVHVAFSAGGPHKPCLPGVMLYPLRSRSNYDPNLLYQIIQLVRKIRPDIIQTWILSMDILCGLAARIRDISWIIREPSSTMAYKNSWKQRLRISMGSRASAIVSNSHGGSAYWKTRLPGIKRFIVPNGVPLQRIDKIKPGLPAGLLTSEMPVVLYVGRLNSDCSADKNLKRFLEILTCVKPRLAFKAVLCGDGPQRPELESLASRLGLHKDVLFTGYLPADLVWAMMKHASVFVSLSAYEGCPNAVLEAMACGCPLVLSDIPAHREILDETCARFVNPADTRQTAHILLKELTESAALQTRAGIAGQKIQKYSIAHMARKYEDVYRSLD
jgi:glycosyltransferase involved in cell wall biosynthesis